ncbi:MAG: hypothetical protein ACLPVY_19985 [Acidimicrobiia bacterium]
MATVEAWYRDTLAYDDGRLQHVRAKLDGREFEPSPRHDITEALTVTASKDPDELHCAVEISGILSLRDEALARPGVLERILELGGGWRDDRLPGLTRPELLSIVAA